MNSRFTFLLVVNLSIASLGFAGARNIERVSPRSGQQGTVVNVEIQGLSLHDPREIIFYKPGIRAFDFKLSKNQPRPIRFPHGGALDMAISCKFEIAENCPPGEYPFRLLTSSELTNLGTFHVSPFRTIEESQGGKRTRETAMPVPANITINGMLDKSSPDIYRVEARAGQRLSAELQCVRIADSHIGGTEYDLALSVLDQSGREIAFNDDNSLRIQDPVLSFVPEKDGDIFVVVRRSVDLISETNYVLHIGNHRRPIVAFPPGGKAGDQVSIRFIGDAAGDYQETITIPKSREFFDYFGDAPTPIRLCSSESPNIFENPRSDETQVTSLPAALNGIIDGPDDVDRYRIRVKAAESLQLRVFAASVGSPIDPVLTITDAEGKVELESDDTRMPERDLFGTNFRSGAGSPDRIDPSVIWTPERDGDYIISLSDASGMGGPQGVYRIDIRKPRTTVQTILGRQWRESTRSTGLAIPRGGRNVMNIRFPMGQWAKLDSPFDLVAHGLPEGVTMTGPRIDPKTVNIGRDGMPMWPVLFEASPNARIEGAVITLAATPVNPSIEVESYSQQNIPMLSQPSGDAMYFVKTDRYVMGVTDAAPFSIEMESPTAALVRGGEIALSIKLTRHNSFNGPVEYWVRFLADSINPQPPTTIPPGETESILKLTATDRASLGHHPLAVTARSLVGEIPRSLGAGDRRNSTKIITLSVAEPWMNLTSRPESVRRGETKNFRWRIEQKTPFEGNAKVRLLGLPKGVTVVALPEVDSKSKEVVFMLKATNEALLGQVRELGCEIVLSVDGQELTQRTGSGTLRIDPALR